MQLENPAQCRSLNQIMASLPELKRAAIAERLMKIESALFQQSRRDVEIVQSIVRVLEHPAHKRLAENLRNLIKGTTNEANAQ